MAFDWQGAENQYLDGLREILQDGVESADRTGVGTLSVFGMQKRYPLTKGFPLLTTKKVWFEGVVRELLWFLSGSTNYKDLDTRVQKWWSPWASNDGDLGSIYGFQLRRHRSFRDVTPKIYEATSDFPENATVFGVGVINSEKKTHCNDALDGVLKSVWLEMLRRCYYTKCRAYKSYGAKGVHVEPRWFVYENFKEDAVRLPRWHLKLDNPDDYSIDKDVLFRSNRYGPETCLWASKSEQSWNTSTGTPFVATSPSGVDVIFPSLGEMSRQYGVNISAVRRCLNGELNTHKGWSNFRYESTKSFFEVDQLSNVIALLKNEPSTRRAVINLWDTASMFTDARLPCCHGSVIQFYVRDNTLSCHTYQRSADMFIGMPVNIASYALLTHMIARECGFGVGDLVYSIGDAHIYMNHFEQVYEQLSRDPRDLPELFLDPTIYKVDDFKFKHVKILGYNPHPTIKAEVAV